MEQSPKTIKSKSRHHKCSKKKIFEMFTDNDRDTYESEVQKMAKLVNTTIAKL